MKTIASLKLTDGGCDIIVQAAIDYSANLLARNVEAKIFFFRGAKLI